MCIRDSNNTGRPKDGAMMTPDGLFDYERAMAANAASQNGSQVIFTNGVNDHDWYEMCIRDSLIPILPQ